MGKGTLQPKTFLEEHIPQMLAGLILLQPVMDIVSFWQGAMGLENTLTLILRFAILAVVASIGFTLSDRKRVYVGLGIVLLLFEACHAAAILQVDAMTLPSEGEVVGLSALLSDAANFVRVAQIPIFTLCFITFLKKTGERGYQVIQKSLLAVVILIAAVEIISVITGTNPYTYPNKSLGILGWFATTNAQSAVLSMAVPIVIMGAIQKETKHTFYQFAICVLGFGILYFFGTRLSFVAILATAVGLTFTILVADRSKKRSIFALLACAAICVGCFKWSPMYQNRLRVAENAELKQTLIDLMVESDSIWAKEHGLEGEDYELHSISGAYNYYLGGLVEKYGLERVADAYESSTEVSDIASARLEKKNFCGMMMEDSPMLSHLFGLELGDMTYLRENYDLENDFHGIYMLYGWAGLALLGLFLFYFIGLIIWALAKNAKRYYTLAAGGYGIALLMGLMHAYATAGVLRRPNASFYLSIILAVIYFLVMIRKYDDSQKTENRAPDKKRERVM